MASFIAMKASNSSIQNFRLSPFCEANHFDCWTMASAISVVKDLLILWFVQMVQLNNQKLATQVVVADLLLKI